MHKQTGQKDNQVDIGARQATGPERTTSLLT